MTILSTFLLTLAVMVLTSTLAAAQTNGANGTNGAAGAHLLESGKAPRLAEPPRANDLKIVSYNIRWRSGKELQEIVRWLKEAGSVRPSIIGLQEVDRARKRSGKANHAKGLADELGMYYAWTAPHETKSEGQEEETGVAILSPYPLTDVTRIVLPNPGPGGRLRVAIGATVQMGKTSVRVYSVHGETRLAERKKVEQQQAVLADLQKFPKGMPVIILGDFNTWEAPAIKNTRKLFTAEGFETPFPDDESTFRQKIVLFDLKLKLDWIWVRGLTPTSYGIDRNLKVSDHFPLWTIVKLPNSVEP
ncbi:MAG TPA: endonuclease/exonuclease/phosphatase family protein [Pyrinomonadaceae bacterium]|nr:endonuclease/exonuclease/phosphatase family protein [Pyrinomonadaceae bacterium]